MQQITVYTAKTIHTMNPSLPLATAVAVRGDRIIEVSSLDRLRPWLDAHPHAIDARFADKVIMPGFIDPHLHPTMAALLLPMHFITAMDWKLPWQDVAAVRGQNAFIDRLRQIENAMSDPDEPLFSWGHHPIWHGEMDRERVNGISNDRPVIVWHRGFHSLVVNDAAVRWMNLDEADLERHPQINAKTGKFFETGLAVAFRSMNPYLLGPARFADGMEKLRQCVHHGGQTTIGDMAFGIFDTEMEWAQQLATLEQDDTPFRVVLVPFASGMDGGDVGPERIDAVRALAERNTHRLKFTNHVKLFADGGLFSGLSQFGPPGRIDGADGEWMMAPEIFERVARLFWNEGFQIHVHCTAELGVELALDTLEKLQWERSRFNHRFTIEHFGLSTPEQVRRMADLGALASVNPNYVFELGYAYWQNLVGFERAAQMSRCGSLVRHGVPTTLHSDFTMAPAQPLHSAWVAANRISEIGGTLCPEECLSLHDALKAITIEAAYILNMEDEIGSIRAGKKADFTILEEDPYEVGAEGLKDIPIWGTVFEGRPFPLLS